MNRTHAILAGAPCGASAPQRRLLMIAYYFAENLSGAHRPFRFAKYLQAFGYDSHIVTASDQEKLHRWESIQQVPTLQTPGWTRDRGLSQLCSIVQRFLPYNDQLQWLPHALAGALAAVRQGSYSAVLSTSPPLVTHLAAVVLKRRYGLNWIADLRDPICGNPFRTRRGASIYDRLLERLVMSEADAVIANTDVERDRLARMYGSRKVRLIWNGYDPEECLAAATIPLGRRKILIHAGSLYGGRHPKALIQSVERLIKGGQISGRELEIRLIGDIELDGEWAKECQLERLEAEGWLSCNARSMGKCEAQRQMQEADFLLLLDLNDQGRSVQVPAKLFEYVRIGRPILAFTAAGSPTSRILGKSGIAHVCIPGDTTTARIDEAVLGFLGLSNSPKCPSAWFTDQFDASRQAGDLAALLTELVGQKH